MIRLLGTAAALAAALLVAGCATAPSRQPADSALLAGQAAREQALAAQPDWSLSGRIAVSAEGDGGSGRIEWLQRGEEFEIRLAAPVTRRSWTLTRRDGVVRLDGLDDGPRVGTDPQVLLYEATGWLIPFHALGAWVRGARAGDDAQIEFTPEGLPAVLREQGWAVEYRQWDASAPPRPLRVFAEGQQGASVRLVVQTWDP